MTIKTLALATLLSMSHLFSSAQENDGILERIQGIHNANGDFLNVDGIEIAVQTKDGELSVKNILKKFRKYDISEAQLMRDSTLSFDNFYAYTRTEEPGVTQHSSYYFFKNYDQRIAGVHFTSFNKRDKAFEAQILQMMLHDDIPDRVYTSMAIDTVNFAGRIIKLGKACHWMGINNIQCPYSGQMNWSVHKTGEDARLYITSHLAMIANKKQGKIISDTTIDVTFEGTAITARKLVYDLVGVTSVLAGTSGGKALTIYAVVAPVRGNWVSCVMSHWNNDKILESGLPPLLEEVMQLKK